MCLVLPSWRGLSPGARYCLHHDPWENLDVPYLSQKIRYELVGYRAALSICNNGTTLKALEPKIGMWTGKDYDVRSSESRTTQHLLKSQKLVDDGDPFNSRPNHQRPPHKILEASSVYSNLGLG